MTKKEKFKIQAWLDAMYDDLPAATDDDYDDDGEEREFRKAFWALREFIYNTRRVRENAQI